MAMWNPNGWDPEEYKPRETYEVLDSAAVDPKDAPRSLHSELWKPGYLLLRAQPGLREMAGLIVDDLYEATGYGEASVVHCLSAVLAAWAADLPASERNHHRRPFGLLGHSLDTACRFIAGAAHSHDENPARLRWLVVGIALALLHDVGKLADFTVIAPSDGEQWDPFREPLTRFRARHGVPCWNCRDSVSKKFPAGVYDPQSLQSATSNISPSTLVHVADPVEWTREYRCFVLEGEVLACSVYRRDGRIIQGHEDRLGGDEKEIDAASCFATSVLRCQPCPPAFVLDVGIIAGKGWAVVETNECWASGIYACDPEPVLETLLRACVRKEGMTAEDSRWDFRQRYFAACP
jgi:hypothetical protein